MTVMLGNRESLLHFLCPLNSKIKNTRNFNKKIFTDFPFFLLKLLSNIDIEGEKGDLFSHNSYDFFIKHKF